MAEQAIAKPFVDGLTFGECPRWHEGRLWYSDFYQHTVSSAGTAGDVRIELHVGDHEPAGLGWLPDGDLVIVNRVGRSLWRRHSDQISQYASLEPWATFHANDMVVDGRGTAYVGNFGFDLDATYDGFRPESTLASIIGVRAGGDVFEAAAGLEFPNGMVVSSDGRQLVVAETLAGRLSVFDIAADATLSNRRVWAELPGVFPDGICLDADGCIWVANAIAPECVRVAEGGEILDRITTSQTCFACMLGGDERTTLYVVTAPESVAERVRHTFGGTIEQATVVTPGAGLP